jgi:hypothetical protein
MSQAWWFIPVISALRRLRQEDHEFETSLGYTVKPCLKKKKNMQNYDLRFSQSGESLHEFFFFKDTNLSNDFQNS